MQDQANPSRPAATGAEHLIEAKGLHKSYRLNRRQLFGPVPTVHAVDGVSFKVARGTTFGLVGESGSGKTTVAKMLLKLERPSAGTMLVDGKDIFQQDARTEQLYHGTVQTVLQDPYGALSPRLKIHQIISEPQVTQSGISWRDAQEHAGSLLELVGLRRDALHKYPHEFSGGQRQRIGIARGLAVEPKLIVCDEPVSALDVSVQAQIINLLQDLQQQRGLAYLFIAHDLAVVEHISRRVMVMYLGKVVELAEAKTIIRDPKHPYTQALLSAVPVVDPASKRKRIVLPGDVPSPITPPSGCPFHPRCPIAEERCKIEIPPLRPVSPGHWAACHLAK